MTTVSVILPTRNRARLLQRALLGLVHQNAGQASFEVIVVDNGSTDSTQEVCEGFLADLRNLKVVRDDRPGLHIGRHVGLERAEGEVVLYGDDDIIPEPTWVGAVIAAFAAAQVGLAGGPCRPDYESTPPRWVDDLVVRTEEGWYLPEFSLLDLGEHAQTISPELVFGCNFAARRSLLEDVGGFHPDGLPDGLLPFRGDGETAPAKAIAASGSEVRYVPEAAVLHHVATERMTVDYIERRSYAEGVSASYKAIRSGISPRSSIAIRSWRRFLRSAFGRSEVIRRKWVAQAAGYRWHQKLARSDPELVKWIMQPDYLDDGGDLTRYFDQEQ